MHKMLTPEMLPPGPSREQTLWPDWDGSSRKAGHLGPVESYPKHPILKVASGDDVMIYDKFERIEDLRRQLELLRSDGLVDIKFMANSGGSVSNTTEHFAVFLSDALSLRSRRGYIEEDLLREIDVA